MTSNSYESKNTLKKGVRMGTSLRGALADAYQTRGNSKGELNFVFSPKAGKDVVLGNKIQYGHFLLCEASAEIQYVDYEAKFDRLKDSNGRSLKNVDAVITYFTGAKECRYVRYSENLNLENEDTSGIAYCDEPTPYCVINEIEIFANPTLIRNWHRVVPWIAQARDTPLRRYTAEVMSLLRNGSATLSKIINLGHKGDEAYFAAAAFRGVQLGFIVSDLDTRPLSLNTLLLDAGARR